MLFDFHTHNLQAPAGAALINLPLAWIDNPSLFVPRAGALYTAGIHPWWTVDEAVLSRRLSHLEQLLAHPQVVAVGECGLDRMRGADMAVQEEVLTRQLRWAEQYRLPVTLHVVRAFDRLLYLRRKFSPTTQWTVHGFRGKPALARQLLQAGFHLSFGKHYHPESYALTPPDCRHEETDEEGENTEAFAPNS